MNSTARRALIVLLATLALVLASTPAHAKKRTWQDKRGDTSQDGLLDIRTVSLVNTKKHTTVTVRVPKEDPEKIPYGETRIYIDSNPKKSGPEYVWFATYPGHLGFFPVKKNKIQWHKPWYDLVSTTKCASTLRETFNLSKGLLRIKIKHKKGCFGNPKKVRTNIRTTVFGILGTLETGLVEYPRPEKDYYPSRTGYTPWVRR